MNNTQGTVFHLNEADPQKHASVLRNVRHLIKELDDDSPVELVTHGPGIAAVQIGAEATGDIEDAIERGVIIAACENTMAAQSLTHADLINGVRTVPSGIAEIVRKQREGWSYAKP